MVVMHLKLDGIYGFNDFEIDFSYPKKVVNSVLESEHLVGRNRFRYKKAVVLMGANATGKTSLGRALQAIMDLIQSGLTTNIYKIASKDMASFSVDFVNNDYILRRMECTLFRNNSFVISEMRAEIDKNDSYEMCVRKLTDYNAPQTDENMVGFPFYDLKGKLSYRFSYPEIDSKLKTDNIRAEYLLKTLRAVIGTLDPSLTDVSVSSDLKNSFIIRREDQEIIIQDGKLLNREVLSSGTAEGVDVSIFLASMMDNQPCFYYCDEHFSYIHSDIEKRLFGIMLMHIPGNGQLIFTTHNTDMLDLNLPKHSFIFLRKKKENGKYIISAISASDILKRNTDSIRNAVENDVFSSLPDDMLLDELEEAWPHE